jgi:hypothetical protein
MVTDLWHMETKGRCPIVGTPSEIFRRSFRLWLALICHIQPERRPEKSPSGHVQIQGLSGSLAGYRVAERRPLPSPPPPFVPTDIP